MLLHRVEQVGHRIAQLQPVLWCRYGVGITVATGVSQWDDQSGNGNHLKQATGANQPALQADGSILFDGSNDFLQTSAFAGLGDGISCYGLIQQASWTSNDYIWDGSGSASLGVLQFTATPDLRMQIGGGGFGALPLTLSTYGPICAVYNSGSSILRVGDTETTGALAAVNPTAFTLGANGGLAGGFSNIQVKEVLVFKGAHDQATRDLVVAYLKRIGGL